MIDKQKILIEQIQLDTLLTGNPKTINMYTFDIINGMLQKKYLFSYLK